MNKIPFHFNHGLLYVPIRLIHETQTLTLQNCIFDTGSAGTTFDADLVTAIGLKLLPESKVKRLSTIGGYQRVFTRVVNELKIGNQSIINFEVEIGDLTSKFKIDGIIGTDIIRKFNWKIDFDNQCLFTDLPEPE